MTDYRFPLELELLDRYLTGSTNRAEDAQILEWLAEHPENARILEAFRTVPLDRTSQNLQTDSHASLAHAEAQLGVEEKSVSANIQDVNSERMRHTGTWQLQTSRKRNRMPVRFVTAAVVLCVMFVFWDRLSPGSVEHQNDGGVPSIVYTTRDGTHKNLTLPDGSTVVLSVGSRLEVPTDFGKKHRTLQFDGEGLFTVTHAAGMPFIVKTGNTAARVLGTTFAVRSYATDSVATISIQQGKVAVGNAIVTANQQAVVSKTGAVRVGRAKPASFSFATGILTLNGMPLSDAIIELNRWYDVDIQIGDPALAKQRIKGDFFVGSRSDLMEVLQGNYAFRVVRDGRVFTLYQRQP